MCTNHFDIYINQSGWEVFFQWLAMRETMMEYLPQYPDSEMDYVYRDNMGVTYTYKCY